ncbi:MAG: hypothetical protein ACXQTE_02810 [Methanosarcinaceae archaeon]
MNHLQPPLGSYHLKDITADQIDQVLMNATNLSSGMPLAPQTLVRHREVLKIIFDEAMFQQLLTSNPVDLVPPFHGLQNPTKPFTIEEIYRFFPDDIDQGLRIWRNLDWYGYFLMQWIGGVRPGEVAAFKMGEWNRELHGAVLTHAIEARTRNRKGLKTAKKGTMAKPILFTEQFETLLTMLEFSGRRPEELAFQVNGRSIEANTANKHLALSAQAAGVNLDGRTQYSLRHTFYTEMLRRLPEKDVTLMAGHKVLRKEYDHRVGLDFLRRAQPMREIINKL